MTTRPRPVVLHSVHARDGRGNQYIPLLLGSVPDGIVTLPFSWRQAIFRRYDLFHLHWPEGLIRGTGTFRDIGKKVLTSALIVRLYVTSTPVVRTLHNRAPHEQPSTVERVQGRLLDRRTVTWIRLNPHTPVPGDGLVVTLPHGHYRDWFASSGPKAVGRVRTLLFFGHVRPYKGLERLLRAFADLDRCDARLRLIGKPGDPALRARIDELAAADDRVSTTLRAVDDATLAHEIALADAVVLPYEDLHNSGAVLLALSLDRPVLVPRNEVTEALAQEVGPWLTLFDPPLDTAGLARALAEIEETPRDARPDLADREWPDLGRRLAAAYAASLSGPEARSDGRP